MANSSTPITPGAGANVDVVTASNGDLRQVMALGTDGDNLAHVEAWGQIHVTQGPATLFYDDFSGSVNSDLWTASSGTAPSIGNGLASFTTTLNTYNFTRSVDLMPNGVGFVDVRAGVRIETAAATGAGRFWGLGTQAVTNAAAVLCQDGAGWEVDSATGALLAVTYSAGARTTVATLVPGAAGASGTGANTSATVPNFRDGGLHRYAVVHRVTQTYWFLDGYQIAMASQSFAGVTMADLPVALVRRNAASFTGTPVFEITAIFAADTNRDATMIADALVPARRARVTPGGAFLVDRSAPETVGVGAGQTFTARSNTVGTSSAVLQSAPATGLSLYITDVSVSNSGSTLSTVSLLPTGGTAFLDIVAAASGGGGSMNFQTPVKLAAATGLSVIASAASTTLFCTVSGYTAT